MIRKNNPLYTFLCYFYKLFRYTITPKVNEICFELHDNDILSIKISNDKITLSLSEDGLSRIKYSLNIYSATPIVMLYVNEKLEVLRLTKISCLKDIMYNNDLLWEFNNIEDREIQLEALNKYIV